MLYILIALAISLAGSLCLLKYGDDNCNGFAMFFGSLLMIVTSIASIASVTYVIVGWNWFAAEQKAIIINREFGTNYTQKEIFYAEDVIDTIRQIKRQRVEVNGNLLKAETQE